MAAFSSPVPSCSTSTQDISIEKALGRLPTNRQYTPPVIENIIFNPDKLIGPCERINQLITPLLDTIFDYLRIEREGITIRTDGFELSPEYYENLDYPVTITSKKNIFILVNGARINTLRTIPSSIASGLERVTGLFFTNHTKPLPRKEQDVQYKTIQETLSPHIDAVIGFYKKIKQLGHISSLGNEVETHPLGLVLHHLPFKRVTYPVLLTENGEIFVYTFRYHHAIKFKNIHEMIHPAQEILNSINTYFGILLSIRPFVSLKKFPEISEKIQEELLNLQKIVNPILEQLVTFAKQSPCGISFSRRQYQNLPYSLCLTRTGDIYVFAQKRIGSGAYTKVKRIIDLYTGKNFTISVPKDGEVDFSDELYKKLRFQDRLNGKPGFLSYCENYVQDSWGKGTPKGLITEEYPLNGKSFLFEYIINLDRESRVKLRLSFMSNLINAIATLHELGIYHLDLCSSNLLVKQSGELAIIDLAFAYDPLNTTPVMGGTFETRPPEITCSDTGLQDKINEIVSNLECDILFKKSCEWNGKTYTKIDLPFLHEIVKKDLCHAYDIWSLGCILYNALFRRPIPGSWLRRDRERNIHESMDDFSIRRNAENQKLLETKDLDSYLNIHPDEANHPAIIWLKKMFNLDYLKRPTIKEIQEEFNEIYKNELAGQVS